MENTRSARYVSALVGAWLFISAFAWAHSGAQFTNTWVMGIVTTGAALLAITSPPIRYVNSLAGLWLMISAFALPAVSAATRWNNAIVGVIVFTLSTVAPRLPAPGVGGTLTHPQT